MESSVCAALIKRKITQILFEWTLRMDFQASFNFEFNLLTFILILILKYANFSNAIITQLDISGTGSLI